MSDYTPLDYDLFAGDCDDDTVILKDKMVLGRKEHTCSGCRNGIKVGETHRNVVGLPDGSITSIRYCQDCCSAMVTELENMDSGLEEYPFLEREKRARGTEEVESVV